MSGESEDAQPAPLGMARHHAQRLSQLEDAVEELEDTIQDLRHENNALRRDLSRLSQDLANEGGPLWRRGKYLKTLINEAERNPGDAAELEVSDAHDVVERDIERPQVYEDFGDIQQEVENGRLPAEICYVKEARNSSRNSRIELRDVTTAEFPSQIGGVRLTGDR